MKSVHVRTASVISILLLAALSRLLPHLPNFTPIAAIALFGASMFERKWQGLVVAFGAMLLSDALIGFHGTMAAVYGSFGLTWLIGYFLLKRPTAVRVVTASLLSSVLFFLITNFAVWYGSTFYPQTPGGLLACYTAGLAFYNGQSFFLNGLFGDLFFSTVLFGGYALLQRRFPSLRVA
ncbi:DUF6580 family putative transport protein [Tellurirhabdus rosea]|uniref:DUF6580 family putative transport protein n=1 Tax=Tellurirhabdus rosea TaxID=2674997 RepID=UPI00225712C8|nr:DUF6580 family putative transport protein [Tellurirhabdus rosea]